MLVFLGLSNLSKSHYGWLVVIDGIWKAKCPIFKEIVAGFRGKVA